MKEAWIEGDVVCNQVTIVMYHFVRDLTRSRYPAIKGLYVNRFEGQLALHGRHYVFVTMEQVKEAFAGGAPLPRKADLLTFDDGYIDHFTQVYPLLDRLGIQGSFFPPVKAITHNEILDVNKVHFVLAAVDDVDNLVKETYRLLDRYRDEYELLDNRYYFEKLAQASRMDSAEVIFVKRLLQRELAPDARSRMTDDLFQKFVDVPQEVFSRELYMDLEQIRTMRRHGMFVGVHGYDHLWLSTLSREEKKRELDNSMEFLEDAGADVTNWVMCYPYGDYDAEVEELLSDRSCTLALTSAVRVATLEAHTRYRLPRLDTNDHPTQAAAEPNHFYLGA